MQYGQPRFLKYLGEACPVRYRLYRLYRQGKDISEHPTRYGGESISTHQKNRRVRIMPSGPSIHINGEVWPYKGTGATLIRAAPAGRAGIRRTQLAATAAAAAIVVTTAIVVTEQEKDDYKKDPGAITIAEKFADAHLLSPPFVAYIPYYVRPSKLVPEVYPGAFGSMLGMRKWALYRLCGRAGFGDENRLSRPGSLQG